jgi:hypothetical protein
MVMPVLGIPWPLSILRNDGPDTIEVEVQVKAPATERAPRLPNAPAHSAQAAKTRPDLHEALVDVYGNISRLDATLEQLDDSRYAPSAEIALTLERHAQHLRSLLGALGVLCPEATDVYGQLERRVGGLSENADRLSEMAVRGFQYGKGWGGALDSLLVALRGAIAVTAADKQGQQ